MKVILTILFFITSGPLLADGFASEYMGYGHMGGVMGLGGFLFWFIVFAVIAFILKSLAGKDHSGQPNESALDIAKKRYARGEISKEELDEIKKNL